MTDTVLVLGPVIFRDFEVPNSITIGGRHRLTVHRLPRGVRVIDALGRDDQEITFNGVFSGSEATLRARAVDALRAAGLPLILTWNVFFYTVILSRFVADYQASNWIPYRITCTVVRDEASGVISSAVTLANQASADLAVAAAAAPNSGIDFSSAQSAFGAADFSTLGTSDYDAAQTSLTSISASVSSSRQGAEALLSEANSTLFGQSSATAGATALLTATRSAGQISQLSLAQAYLGRASLNLANAST